MTSGKYARTDADREAEQRALDAIRRMKAENVALRAFHASVEAAQQELEQALAATGAEVPA